MAYIGTSPTQAVRTRFLYTATASQTTFSGADTQNLTLRYSDANFVDVYQNGVLLKGGGADYTATTTTSVVLATGATADDVIEIIVYDVFAVANLIKKDGDTVEGVINFNGKEITLDADFDTSITADTDDQIDIKIAGSDSIRIKANEIENVSSDLTLDVANDIVLDADGGNWRFKDDGTAVLTISRDSNTSVNISSAISNADLIFKGNDSGSTIEMARFDVENGGRFGIGTTTPGNTLDVHGGIVCSPNTEGKNTFELSTNDLDEGRLEIKDVDTTTVRIRAGGASFFNGGNIGIGESSPSALLHLKSSGPNIKLEDSDNDSDFEIKNGNGTLRIIDNTNSADRLDINSSGQVQVNGNQTLLDSDTFFQVNVNGGNGDDAFMAIACNGSNTANQQAGIYLGRTNNRIMTTVDGSANFRDDIQIRAGGSGGVSLSSGGTSFTGASDEKLKTIIENITGALDNVAKLRTVIGRYEWDAEDKRRSFLIAQDVQTVLPEVVEENPEGNLMLDYTGVIPLLTAALKEAKTKIETLETKVTALESK